jgi:hypothetical protein
MSEDRSEMLEVRALRRLNETLTRLEGLDGTTDEREQIKIVLELLDRLRSMLTDFDRSILPPRPLIPLREAYDMLNEDGRVRDARRILKGLRKAWVEWQR